MARDHRGGQSDFDRSAMPQDTHTHQHPGDAANDHGGFRQIQSLHCIPSCCLTWIKYSILNVICQA
jgi:hypothetical protein